MYITVEWSTVILKLFYVCLFWIGGSQVSEASLESSPSKRMESSDQSGYSLHLLYSYTMQTPGMITPFYFSNRLFIALIAINLWSGTSSMRSDSSSIFPEQQES